MFSFALPLWRHHRILLHGDVLFHARERVGRVRGVNRLRLLLDGARQLFNLPQAGLRERVGSLLNLRRLFAALGACCCFARISSSGELRNLSRA